VDTAVVVPVKAFSQAKERLSGVLGPHERAALARRMAEHVLSAAAPLPVFVVCDDAEVSSWARRRGAGVLDGPGRGLNGAVGWAFSELGQRGYGRVIVAHSDLPLATSLGWLGAEHGIVLVPDRREEGTNVIALPTGCRFRFSYGPGSFARHKDEAGRSGLPWRVVRDPGLAWDVDFPGDMAAVGL
jgi:2-phospho-L-lactate guanylyltransferase